MRPLSLLVLAAGLLAADSAASLVVEDGGKLGVKPFRDPGAFANPWPASWQAGLRERTDLSIRQFKGKAATNTFGEGEKRSYPANIGAFWAGDREPAIAGLTATDTQADSHHEWTGGFDFYWCFNLKGQVPKWFLFRNDFPETYRTAYAAAAKTWSASDPRPSMEYVMLLDSSDAAVRAFAAAELDKMWRNTEQLRAMADGALKDGHPNKKVFAEFIRAQATAIGTRKPATIPEWNAWWGKITGGDWMVFEEYEREVNPNPHPRFGIGSGPVGAQWDPNIRGTRADARNTDNLRAMREVAVYLFAEDSGNDLMRKVYKDKLRRTAIGFWEMGNGEWDSEGYLAHAIAPYHSLYAFAKDDDVRGYAKAILDFMYTSAAMKYWQGSWGGPVKRDYGNVVPYSSAAHVAWLWFGGAPNPPADEEPELAFTFHSGYRPPAAVVALGRKQFPRPMQVYATHPSYSNWLPGEGDQPQFRETMGWGDTWQMGSLAKGGGDDVNGCKILVASANDCPRFVVPGIGKNKTITNLTTGADNLGQHRNLLIWVSGAQGGKAPMQSYLPFDSEVTIDGATAFVKTERTWLAFTAVNGSWDAKIGESGGGKKGTGSQGKLLKGAGSGGEVAGFILELGEEKTHGDFAAFTAAIKAKQTIAINGTSIAVVGASGARLNLAYQAGPGGLPGLTMDGVARDWSQYDLWKPAIGPGPVSLGWKERKLVVEAGGHHFEGVLSPTGAYSWSQRIGKE